MSITIIISYFNPEGKQNSSFQMLKETIKSVRNQTENFDHEIIICDDGSRCNKNVFTDNGISIKTKVELENNPDFEDLEFDKYLYHHTDRYQRANLWKKAIDISINENLVFLDDDTAFLKQNSMKLYEKYFKFYSYIKGRCIGFTGMPHLYSDTRVQGANFGIKKNLINTIGCFSDFIYDDSFGDDDDLTYKVYKYISSNNEGHKACYAGDIIIQNCASSRWHSGKKDKDERGEIFNKKFKEEHGIHDNYNMGSRNKRLWLEFPSWRARLMEHYYKFIYFGKMRLGWKDIFRYKELGSNARNENKIYHRLKNTSFRKILG